VQRLQRGRQPFLPSLRQSATQDTVRLFHVDRAGVARQFQQFHGAGRKTCLALGPANKPGGRAVQKPGACRGQARGFVPAGAQQDIEIDHPGDGCGQRPTQRQRDRHGYRSRRMGRGIDKKQRNGRQASAVD
jgi:hypothetical protein